MIEWDRPGRLNTPVGDLPINVLIPDVGYFMADPAKCAVKRSLRVTSDGVPQGDGRILHRRFSDGVELTVALELWKTIGDPGEPACGEDLRVMLETLGLYLQAVLNGRGRWFWQPSGYADERMLDEARWLIDVSRSLDGRKTTVTFGLDSPFPYFVDATQGSSMGSAGPVHVSAGVPVTLVNDGNHGFRPVIQAVGAFTDFVIQNESVLDEVGDPLSIVYDSGRPFPSGESGVVGSSHYAEIDTFRESIYLDGNVANLKPGIDPEETDYFYLRPGGNVIASNVNCLFLINNAWVPG